MEEQRTEALKMQKFNSQNSTLSKKQVNQNLNADVLKWYNQFRSIEVQLKLAKSNVETIQKVYNTAEQQLKQGAINGFDFRQTQLTLLSSELTVLQLQFSQKNIEINLNRISGMVLKAYL